MKVQGTVGIGAKAALSMNLKRLREVRGLTQEEMTERAKISRNYLVELIKGVKFPSAEVLDRIAAALGVAVSELFSVDASTFERVRFNQEVRKRLHSSLDLAIDELSMESAKNKGSG